MLGFIDDGKVPVKTFRTVSGRVNLVKDILTSR